MLAACGDDPDDVTAPDDDDTDETVTDDDDDDVDDAPAEAPSDRLVIDVVFDTQVESVLDPHRDGAPFGRFWARALYDTLLTYPTDDFTEPSPWLATDWEVNDDATEFTFHIRDDVNFSDGTPLTAHDVEWSLNRLSWTFESPSFLVDGVDVEAVDDYTVVMTTETTFPALPSLMANPNTAIMNSALMEEYGGLAEEGAADDGETTRELLLDGSAGSGVYVVERAEPGIEIVLRANPEFWGPAPLYDEIVLRNAEPGVQLLNIQSGEADIVMNLSEDDLGAIDESAFQVERSLGGNAWMLTLNLDPDVSITANPDIAEAIRYALDYDALAEVGGPGASALCAPIIPQIFAAVEDGCLEQDIERAEAAIERSGEDDLSLSIYAWDDMDRDGILLTDLNSRVAEQLRAVGFDVSEVAQPAAVINEQRNNGELDILIAPLSIRYPDPHAYVAALRPGGGQSNAGGAYRGGWLATDHDENHDIPRPHPPVEGQEEIEELSDRAQAAADPDEREELYQEWQRWLIERGPYIPTIIGSNALVAQEGIPNVVGLHPSWELDIPYLVGSVE